MFDATENRPGRIPLTVVGGFLGSGKTTVLNQLLETTSGRRIAVLVNDFGPINIDARLIAKHDGETISLTNGCICCSIGSGLDAALIDVLSMRPKPDWIVIEASGVSDPAPIANVGLTEPDLSLAGVVTVLDAEHLPDQAEDPLLRDTVRAQIKGADLLVLNKTDLITADQLSKRKDFIRAQFGLIPVYETRHGIVPEDLLLQSADTSNVREELASRARAATSTHPFQTRLWQGSGVLSADRLMQYFRQLPRGIFRAKGIVQTDYHGVVAIQFAGRRLQFIPMASTTGSLIANQIVFIGVDDAMADTVFSDLDTL